MAHRALIIGAGGVASVVIAKCCQNSEVFGEIMIASRTKSKCDAIKERLQPTTKTVISTAAVDADNVPELVALIKEYKPEIVINVALPYQDLHIMDACLECKVDYLDTANYEPEDTASFPSTVGSGRIVSVSRKRELPPFSAAASTRELREFSPLTLKSTSSMR